MMVLDRLDWRLSIVSRALTGPFIPSYRRYTPRMGWRLIPSACVPMFILRLTMVRRKVGKNRVETRSDGVKAWTIKGLGLSQTLTKRIGTLFGLHALLGRPARDRRSRPSTF
jgi:hypothetical protein